MLHAAIVKIRLLKEAAATNKQSEHNKSSALILHRISSYKFFFSWRARLVESSRRLRVNAVVQFSKNSKRLVNFWKVFFQNFSFLSELVPRWGAVRSRRYQSVVWGEGTEGEALLAAWACRGLWPATGRAWVAVACWPTAQMPSRWGQRSRGTGSTPSRTSTGPMRSRSCWRTSTAWKWPLSTVSW